MSKRKTNNGRTRGAAPASAKKTPINKLQLGIVGVLVIALGGTAVALLKSSEKAAEESAFDPDPLNTSGVSTVHRAVPWPPGIPDPEPFQYDPVSDSHFYPDHNHWHAGKPPPPGSAPAHVMVPAPANIPDPFPWQYDAATDRHYDPGHQHWHAGKPPQLR